MSASPSATNNVDFNVMNAQSRVPPGKRVGSLVPKKLTSNTGDPSFQKLIFELNGLLASATSSIFTFRLWFTPLFSRLRDLIPNERLIISADPDEDVDFVEPTDYIHYKLLIAPPQIAEQLLGFPAERFYRDQASVFYFTEVKIHTHDLPRKCLPVLQKMHAFAIENNKQSMRGAVTNGQDFVFMVIKTVPNEPQRFNYCISDPLSFITDMDERLKTEVDVDEANLIATALASWCVKSHEDFSGDQFFDLELREGQAL